MKQMPRKEKNKEKQKEAARRYYERNREAMIARAALAKVENRAAIRKLTYEYLLEHPCIDCGERDPIVLDFDHRGNKEFNIADAVAMSYGVTRVKAEIAKCDVRCANCHRRKTHAERLVAVELSLAA